MRVIAGSAKHLILKTLESNHTRPTTDRIKETLFNILQFDLPGRNFLDLFAGSGGIGIEALSRGAESAVFVENHPAAVKIIQENLKHTKLSDRAEVMASDCAAALSRMNGKGRHFDYVFMDPPYGQGLELRALQLLRTADYIDADTCIIVERDIHADTEELEALGYALVRAKKYKTNQHIFLKRKEKAQL